MHQMHAIMQYIIYAYIKCIVCSAHGYCSPSTHAYTLSCCAIRYPIIVLLKWSCNDAVTAKSRRCKNPTF